MILSMLLVCGLSAVASTEAFCTTLDLKNIEAEFFLESDTENQNSEDLPENFVLSGKTYQVEERLGAGQEGTAWLVSEKDSGSLFVIKEFFKDKDYSRNMLGLKRLERALRDFRKEDSGINAEVVSILKMDQKNKRLLLSYAEGIVGNTLYDEESGMFSKHGDTMKFYQRFETLSSYVGIHRAFKCALTTKNVVWQEKTGTIVIFDPF